MTGKRKRYSAELKAKVALDAIRAELTVDQRPGFILEVERGSHNPARYRMERRFVQADCSAARVAGFF